MDGCSVLRGQRNLLTVSDNCESPKIEAAAAALLGRHRGCCCSVLCLALDQVVEQLLPALVHAVIVTHVDGLQHRVALQTSNTVHVRLSQRKSMDCCKIGFDSTALVFCF